MKTILDILHLTTHFLEKKGFLHPRQQAQDLISRALALKPMDLYLHFDKPLAADELETCRQWLARRAKHEPAAYIEGRVQFFDCEIEVSRAVLIPRQETELLVDKMAKVLSGIDLTGKVLWDICTGSGCMGIALQRRFPQLQVVLSDISKDALQMAERNAQANQVQVELLLGDLFTPFSGRQADFIVCNPPYISAEEYLALDEDVKFEPKLALVGGESGLEFYERLARELAIYLKGSGKAWLELGHTQGERVQGLFDSEIWATKCLERDLAGWDRFFFLEKD